MVTAAIGRKGNTSPAAEATKRCRVGKANGSRERAPDDKLRVPTIKVGTAQARLCPPYEVARNGGD